MKILYGDIITSITADSEKSGYPDDNLLDYHPANLWKSNIFIPTLTILSGTTAMKALYLGNTSTCTSVAYVAKDSGDSTVESGTMERCSARSSLDARHHYWKEFSGAGIVKVEVTLTNTALRPEAGVAYAVAESGLYEYDNPDFGMGWGGEDFSIRERMNNGSVYAIKRDATEVFSGEILTEADTTTGTCPLFELAMSIRTDPFPVKILDDGYSKLIFGEFTELPESEPIGGGYCRCEFEIQERT